MVPHLDSSLNKKTNRKISSSAFNLKYRDACISKFSPIANRQQSYGGLFHFVSGEIQSPSSVSFGLSYTRPKLVQFIARYPKVDVELDLNDRIVKPITKGLDVPIRASKISTDSSLISPKLTNSRALSLASPEYLKQHGTPKTPLELLNHQAICYRDLNHPELRH